MFICINSDKGYPTGMCEGRRTTEQGHANTILGNQSGHCRMSRRYSLSNTPGNKTDTAMEV